MLESRLSERDTLDPHVRWLLAQLPPTLGVLERLTKTWSAKLYCGIYTSGARPTLYLDSVILGRLSQLPASLDLDLYVLPSEPESAEES